MIGIWSLEVRLGQLVKKQNLLFVPSDFTLTVIWIHCVVTWLIFSEIKSFPSHVYGFIKIWTLSVLLTVDSRLCRNVVTKEPDKGKRKAYVSHPSPSSCSWAPGLVSPSWPNVCQWPSSLWWASSRWPFGPRGSTAATWRSSETTLLSAHPSCLSSCRGLVSTACF